MAKQDDYVRYTVRVPAHLYERLKDSAGEKSINAELVDRLELSFSDQGDYKTLAEATLASMEEMAENSRRELREYRVMSSQIRLLRHVVGRLAVLVKSDLPEDLRVLVNLLGLSQTKDVTDDGQLERSLLVDAMNALEQLEAIEAEQVGPEGKARQVAREAKMDAARRLASERAENDE